ncbi:DMT family transporter [Hoeflea sp. TYP-13]|uniref:DMT family transporter n=1 Tax=Hoeflea sp. TYP-13 TaxID=3230023 RepID=UPI0034C6149D
MSFVNHRISAAPNYLPPIAADSPIQGIVLVAFGIGIFSLQDVIIRWIGSTYPAFEIVFLRGLIAMIPIGAMVYFSGGFSTLRVPHPWFNCLRGMLGLLSYTAYYMALVAMPIAEATAIFFVSPLIVTLFSALFLKETVGIRRWAAVIVGFAGVVVIMRPGAGLLNPVAVLPLLAALTYASSSIITRRIGKTQSGASLAFFAMAVFVLFSAISGALIGDGKFATISHPSIAFLLRSWTVPSLFDGLLILICGLIAAVGFFCLAQAYRIAPASVVAPFEFVAMPLAMFWGVLIWTEYPSSTTILGVVLIVGSGIYVLNREAVRKRPLATGRGIRLRL